MRVSAGRVNNDEVCQDKLRNRDGVLASARLSKPRRGVSGQNQEPGHEKISAVNNGELALVKFGTRRLASSLWLAFVSIQMLS